MLLNHSQVCEALLVRRLTYGYLLSRRAAADGVRFLQIGCSSCLSPTERYE